MMNRVKIGAPFEPLHTDQSIGESNEKELILKFFKRDNPDSQYDFSPISNNDNFMAYIILSIKFDHGKRGTYFIPINREESSGNDGVSD